MEAKDTVIPIEERIRFGVWHGREHLTQAQAEVSFKAGIREVVEFYKAEQIKKYGYPLSLDANWQAKLKEWGV